METEPVPRAPHAHDGLLAELPLGPISKRSMRGHSAKKAWILDRGDPIQLPIGQAEIRGYTVIDLGDRWVPYIFTTRTAGTEDEQPNDYADRYIDLANNRTDSDGDPLGAHEINYLELYGIPPTLGALRKEWSTANSVETCLTEAGFDAQVFSNFSGTLVYSTKPGRQRAKQARRFRNRLAKAMKKAKIPEDDRVTANKHPKTRSLANNLAKIESDIAVISHAQIRLRCEQMFDNNKGRGRFKPGVFDSATHHALARFDRKQNIMGWGHFTKSNTSAFARLPRATTYERLRRVIAARVIAAAHLLEDGSARSWKQDFTWNDTHGSSHGLRDLTSEFTNAALHALGMTDPGPAFDALDTLATLGGSAPDFGERLVAVRLPDLPEYYADDMDFETVIDRGDVWYDFPYNEEGTKIPQPRRRFPHLTLYVRYRDQRIPLVHWRTTIGSWRSEELDGVEWFKYKDSDVGERIWETIMAAPVWIPPASTPTRSLVKRKYKDGRLQSLVNYDETGPSYKSAYGLVAAYHIRRRTRSDGSIFDIDNQIRTHGSVDYMSIQRRYSHGCHRLYNMNAVRMFSFILGHRGYIRHGQKRIGYRRDFTMDETEFHIALDTRGYRYQLTRPIPVIVTEGRIRGKRRQPYTDAMPKPGVDYSSDSDQQDDLQSIQEPTSESFDPLTSPGGASYPAQHGEPGN